MEHKLITGGEQYLPFARSRIKALRATGLKYASQQFEIDGCSVKARIEPGHEYISLSGGVVSLAMDSGVVDVTNIAPLNPSRYAPGVLYESEAIRAYQAQFIERPDDPPGRTNPGTSSLGQLAGVISRGRRFKGRILDSTSFAPREIPLDPPTIPATTSPDPADDLLHLKKQTAILCPPSIFTGRCRLYIQAMYGLPLYEYKKDRSLLRVNEPPEVLNDTSAAPSLKLRAYSWKGDTTTYPDVMINTSTGVWLDPDTNRHWLIRPMNSTVAIYPLRSTPEGETLRKYLKPLTGTDALNAEDRAHLEAYILAHSLPDVKNKQIALGGYSCGDYSMGYGWHWNWDGTVADLVYNETFDQDARNAAMRSTHFRMTIRKVPVVPPAGGFTPGSIEQTWESPVSVVSGPNEWSVPRGSWCITEPDYGGYILAKTTPKHSIRFTGEATFYAFYRENTLVTCRVDVKYVEAGTPSRAISPGFSGSLEYQANDITWTTLGERDGFLVEQDNWGWSYTATFSCGGETTPLLYEGRTNTGVRVDLDNKRFLGWASLASYTHFETQSFPSGYPREDGSYETETYLRNSVSEYSATYSYDITSYGFTESKSGSAQIVVPFYDSEAVYMRWSTSENRSEEGIKQQWLANLSGFNYQSKSVVNVYDPPLSSHDTDVLKYGWQAGGGSSGAMAGTTTAVTKPVVTVTATAAKLICGAGTVNATFDHINEFQNNTEDFVGAEFSTLTSRNIVIAPGHAESVGVSGMSATPSVIVGWA